MPRISGSCLPIAADVGAGVSRVDIVGMASNFLSFDVHLYNFLVDEADAAQQSKFKSLNVDTVHGGAARTGAGRYQSERVDQRRGEGFMNARANPLENRPHRKL